MLQIGYTLSSEEHKPQDLIENAADAEAVGFAFAMISDHYHPWVDTQGQSPFVWSVIGGISQVTKTLKVGTGVTCPIIRIHPAIIAQAAATAQELLEGRFMLGVGTGENLNEHVIGMGWPPIDTRREMLVEAVEILRLLWQGGYQSYEGQFFTVDSARIYTLPKVSIPIHIAASGPKTAKMAGKIGDGFISTSPKSDLVQVFEKSGGKNKPKYAQINICWQKDQTIARKIVHKLWPNSAMPKPLNTELKIPKYFENVATMISEDEATKNFALGPDPQPILDSIQKYIDAGFDHIYIHQIGDNQKEFLKFAQKEILPHFKIKHGPHKLPEPVGKPLYTS